MLPFTASAQVIWQGADGTGGDGAWGGSTNWVGGSVPTIAGDARFQVDATRTAASADIAVSGTQTSKSLQFGVGKQVTLELAAGASLTANTAASTIGGAYGTGTGAASVLFQGPESGVASMSLSRFDVVRGSSLTFSGTNLTVTTDGDSSLGRDEVALGGGNTLNILSGAKASMSTLTVGRGTSSNELAVSGVGSSLNVSGAFGVGASRANSTLNVVKVQDGASLSISGVSTVGGTAGSHSNSVAVSGSGSEMIVGELRVGDNGGLNAGGNNLQVGNGGVVRLGTHAYVNSHSSPSSEYGSNRIRVNSGGTLTSAASLTVRDKALLQLASGGAIEGRTTAGAASSITVNILSGGRFEAAGSGLGAVGTTAITNVSSGGTFAVGLSDSSTASTLTLSNTASKLNLAAGSILEFGLYGDGLNDQMAFTANSILSVAGSMTVQLTLEGYAVVEGDSWVLFDGLTTARFSNGSTSAVNLAASSFILPTLSGGLSWDTTRFNVDDGWVIAVVPEPSAVMLLGGAALIFLGARRLRRLKK